VLCWEWDLLAVLLLEVQPAWGRGDRDGNPRWKMTAMRTSPSQQCPLHAAPVSLVSCSVLLGVTND